MKLSKREKELWQMYRVAVCDDNRETAEQIGEIIKNYDNNYVVDIFGDGKELLASREQYEVLFLDIDMEGIDGIETARKLRERDKNVKIIYVTSYTDYVNYAFSVHAFAYLLKPVSEKEIHSQLEEAVSYSQESKYSDILRFETGDGVENISMDEISYFEYFDRKVHMHLKNRNVTVKGGIGEIATRMEPFGFAVPHKSFVVNLYYVKVIKGYDIYMMDGAVIPLSQKKSADFRKRLHQFLGSYI